MIHITSAIAIDEDEIHQEFIQASGPGGQNVNKVATAVQLRFDVSNSPSLSHEIRNKLLQLPGRRITKEGVLIINARRFRSQEANREDAINRLVELIRRATEEPQIRRKTKPTYASKIRRLEAKRHRAKTKYLRRIVSEGSDS